MSPQFFLRQRQTVYPHLAEFVFLEVMVNLFVAFRGDILSSLLHLETRLFSAGKWSVNPFVHFHIGQSPERVIKKLLSDVLKYLSDFTIFFAGAIDVLTCLNIYVLV